MIRLEPMNLYVVHEVKRLELFEYQKKFIASNIESIAEVRFRDSFDDCAILCEQTKKVIGYVYFGLDEDTLQWKIVRFMIGKRFQNNGYGKEALKKILHKMFTACSSISEIFLEYHHNNTIADKLYQSMGFENYKSNSLMRFVKISRSKLL